MLSLIDLRNQAHQVFEGRENNPGQSNRTDLTRTDHPSNALYHTGWGADCLLYVRASTTRRSNAAVSLWCKYCLRVPATPSARSRMGCGCCAGTLRCQTQPAPSLPLSCDKNNPERTPPAPLFLHFTPSSRTRF